MCWWVRLSAGLAWSSVPRLIKDTAGQTAGKRAPMMANRRSRARHIAPRGSSAGSTSGSAGFHQLDQHLLAVWRTREEEIDAGAIRARPRRGIDGLLAEARAEDLRRAVHVLDLVLHLLDALA